MTKRLTILILALVTILGLNLTGESKAFWWKNKINKIIEVGNLVIPRKNHTATLLIDGRVLITGGDKGGPLNTAEIYDPKKQEFQLTSEMAYYRTNHKAVRLKDGRVLIYGGIGKKSIRDNVSVPIEDIEAYDPQTNQFKIINQLPIRTGSMIVIPLKNGLVYFKGEALNNGNNVSYLYNPVKNKFSYLGNIGYDNICFDGLELGNQIFLYGCKMAEKPPVKARLGYQYFYEFTKHGYELIDPNNFENSKFVDLKKEDWSYKMGGMVDKHHFVLFDISHAYLFKSDLSDLESPVIHKISNVKRDDGTRFNFFHTSKTILPDGNILVWGGVAATELDNTKSTAAHPVEILNPFTGKIKNIGEPKHRRESRFTTTVLLNGSVLVAGGQESLVETIPTFFATKTAELYTGKVHE